MIPIRAPQILASMLLSLVLPMGTGCGSGPGPEGPREADRGIDEEPPTGDIDVFPGDGDQGDSNVDGPPSFPKLPGMAEPLTDEELEAMSAEELVNRAREIFNPDEQIRMLGIAVEKDPESREALLRLVEAEELKGIRLALSEGKREESKPYLDRAAALARKLRDREEPLVGQERELVAMAFYNEACNFALADKPDEAMQSLQEAIELDFSNPVIFDDPELDLLRDRDDFKAILERIPEPTESTVPSLGPAPALQ
jgi:tetratricopeptide (TPR) repeat protein